MARMGLVRLAPREAAERIVRDADAAWAREFLASLGTRLGGGAAADLERVMAVWELSAADVARMVGVSRQAVAKWRRDGVPGERAVAVADLAAATDVLLRYVRPERIPAVVRRPADLLDGRSLLQVAESGDTEAVRLQVAAMLDLRRVAP